LKEVRNRLTPLLLQNTSLLNRNQDHEMDQPSPMRKLALVLPLPPSINHQYATVHGRRVLSRAGRDFKLLVAETIQDWLERHDDAAAIVAVFQQHYLSLTIIFYFATALRRDLDGGLKIAQDALCEALGTNDNLVVEICLSKRVDRHKPRIEVFLTALPPESIQLYQGEGESSPLPVVTAPRRQRRRRKSRSLAELATRFHWE
jgi:crossover junction endodeoxyribonuclease RusA